MEDTLAKAVKALGEKSSRGWVLEVVPGLTPARAVWTSRSAQPPSDLTGRSIFCLLSWLLPCKSQVLHIPSPSTSAITLHVCQPAVT